MNNPEASLSPNVAKWLKSFGCEVYSEVPLYGTSIDLVGIDFSKSEIIAVELKMSFSEKLLRSAMINQIATLLSWAAAPTEPQKKAIAFSEKTGVGLLRIYENKVVVVRSPQKRFLPNRFVAEKILGFCQLDEPNDIGGIACLKGRGPAQRVYSRIVAFVDTNPGSNWQDIYEGVPNHYANPRSLQGSMSKLYSWGKVAVPIRLGKHAVK